MQNQDTDNPWIKGIRIILDALQTPLSLIAVILNAMIYVLKEMLPIKDDSAKSVNTSICYVLIGILALLVVVFCILCLFKPENLIYDKEASLRDKGKPPFGTAENPMPKEKASLKNVKPNEAK